MLVQRIIDLLVGEKLRIGIWVSIAALVVSTATLFLVSMSFVTERSESSEHDAEHSQDITVTMVQTLIENHANVLIKSNGITEENIEDVSMIPGWGCFWTQKIYDGKARAAANAGDTPAQSYSYDQNRDVWFVTSVDLFCENGMETWTVNDDSGEITYGRLDD